MSCVGEILIKSTPPRVGSRNVSKKEKQVKIPPGWPLSKSLELFTKVFQTWLVGFNIWLLPWAVMAVLFRDPHEDI